MSFLSRFCNRWKQRKREIEGERYFDAILKSVARNDALENLIAKCLMIYGVVPDEVVVQNLASIVVERQSVPPIQIIGSRISLERFVQQSWEINTQIVDEVIKEYMASNVEGVRSAKAMREASVQKVLKQRQRELKRQDDT